MEAGKNDQETLLRAIGEWERSGLLPAGKAEELRNSVSAPNSDRRLIAQYFFFIALFCTLLAFGAIFLDEKLLERIKAYFAWSDMVIATITASLSALWFWYVRRKRLQVSGTGYEIYMVLGGLATLTSMVYSCKAAGIDKTYTVQLGLSALLLAILAQGFRSGALWIGALVAAIGWFAMFTNNAGSDNLFLGMNYPMRFAALGLVITATALLQRQFSLITMGWRTTYAIGLTALFTGLWGISIFGNYNSLAGWQQVRQVHVLAYSIVFGLAAIASFVAGLRYKDELARDFGVLFLLINLYTRYFEYFWNSMNKGIFFLVLAITFGGVGWLLEHKRKGRQLEGG